jgi:mono/diheme cytochrome c family protein
MAAPVALKVSAFALVVMGAYTWYANSIPQLDSKPPEELSLEGATVTPEQLVTAGEKIFNEKGQCKTCHTIGGPAAGGRPRRRRRPGGHAAGTSAKAYLVESLINPAPSSSPPSRTSCRGSTGRRSGSTGASCGRRSPTWRARGPWTSRWTTSRHRRRSAGGAQAAASVDLPGDPKAGQAVFTGKGACVACQAGASGEPVGPDLSTSGQPDARVRRGRSSTRRRRASFRVPGRRDAADRQALTAKEYIDLVSFLMTLKGGGAAPAAPAKS